MKWILCLTFFAIPALADWEIANFAGTGEKGFSGDGGPATKAKLNNVFGVVRGPDGAIYICDTSNHAIRKVDTNGTISTVAGTGEKGYSGDGGLATKAKLFEPYEIRFASNGDMVFVEMRNHLIRRVDVKTGRITTIAGTGKQGFSGDGGLANKATFNRPHSIQFGPKGDLFVCDIGNHRIRKIDMKTGVITTICGTGEKKQERDGAKISPETPLKGPRAIDFDRKGNMWLALREGNQVWKLDLQKGTMHHIAGTGKKGFTGNGGPAKKATLSGPKGISISGDNLLVVLADTESHSVRAIDLSSKPAKLVLLAGTGKKGDGPIDDPLQCKMARLHGVFIDPKTDEIFIGDSETNRVRVLRKK